MLTICDSIELAISNENWYAALLAALTLPDICGAIEYPHLRKSVDNGIITNRYTKWFDTFVGEAYKVHRTLDSGSPTYPFMLKTLQMHSHHLEQLSEYKYAETFLNGFECYVLRCKFLHEGLGNVISKDQAANILNGFDFWRPVGNSHVHNNLSTRNGRTVVQLQVDVFSKGIATKAREWWSARTNGTVNEEDFLRIR